MFKITTLVLLVICVVQSTPIDYNSIEYNYGYRGTVKDYTSSATVANGPLNISLEMMAYQEIATYNLPNLDATAKYIITYEVILQNLTIGANDLVTTPIIGNAKLTYGHFGFWFDIGFQKDNVNLFLYREEEYCRANNPVTSFNVFYSNDYINYHYDANIRGGVICENFWVPEPSYYSLFLLSLPFIFVGQIRFFRRRKIDTCL
jgi:hypothetical protein